MKTGRFNWIVLLVLGTACLAIGALGLFAGEPAKTVVWFALGAGALVGFVVLYRMRLP
jgi:hypothetical protein